jgi:hypothetical protein
MHIRMHEGEESPDNKEHRTSEREDVREGIAAEKKKTARSRPGFGGQG